MITIYDIYEGIMDRSNRQTIGDTLSINRELEQFNITKVRKAPYAIDIDGNRDDRKERTDFLFVADCPILLSMIESVSGISPYKLEIRAMMEKFRGGWPVETHYSHDLIIRLLDKNGNPCSENAEVYMDTWPTQKDCKTDLIKLINTIGKSQDKFNEFIEMCWKGVYNKYNYVPGIYKFMKQ